MLEVSPELIHFGDVAVNDIPAYRPFKVRNTQAFPLTIQLSGVDDLIRFQERNENFSSLTAGRGNYGTYDPLFDSVGVLSELQLLPFEEKDVVVSFRAAPETFTHASSQATAPYTRSIQFITTPTISGSFADVANGNSSPVGLNLPVASPTTTHSESLSVPYQATVFVSQLEVSVSEIQMTMGINKTSIQSFTVTNTSCCPLSFVIRNQMMPHKGINMALYEAELLESPKLGHTLMVDSQASINFALLVQTMTPSFGQHQAVLQCDNLRDGRNSALIYVNINVVAESQGELVSLSDSSLNFGDVYRGTEARGEIGLQNVDGREEVTVALASSNNWKYSGSVKLLLNGLPVDEVVVPPQKGPITVTVAYRPTFDREHKESSKVKFDLELSAQSGTRQQRLTVRCAAALFTSSIAISHTNVNFGDCCVGQTKKYTFIVENQSPLPCSVVIQLRSKIISIDGVTARQSANERETRAKFSVGPLGTLPVTLRIAPQRVNPTYRKQLTVVNASNPNEDIQVINIESNNMAPSEAKVHNELYAWECRTTPLDSDGNAMNLHAVTNVPLLVPYLARSKVDRPITLNIQTTSSEIEVLYAGSDEMADALDSVEAEMRAIAPYGDSMDSSAGDVAPDRVSQVRKELLKILAQGVIITNEVVLEPFGSVRVYALIIRTTFANEPLSKEDGLTISVLGVDIPRFVRLSYKLCSTSFVLSGQKTKNFGEVNIGTRKNTKLEIVNRCKSTLFLCVSKSRSVTAGHIRLGSSDKQAIFLCIRPYATKEVELLFFPGIKGIFEEKIHLTNVLDPKNDVVVTVKATVTKADTFEITPDSWNFGMLTVPGMEDLNRNTRVGAKFIVSNTSKSRRQVGVRLDTNTTSGIQDETQEGHAPRLRYQGVEVQLLMDVELSGASSGSTRKVEEQIEKLEQKIKIYSRKKKMEKLAAAKKRVETLKRALLGEEVDLSAVENTQTADPDFSESEDESSSVSSALRNRSQNADVLSLLLRDGMLLPTMNAGETVTLTVALICTRVADQSLPALQANTINLLLYEAADQEITRIVPIDVIFTRPEGESGSPATASGAPALPAPTVQQERAIISLESSGGFGRPVSLFMGYPIIVLRNTIVNDHADFSFLVRADRKTSVVILEPKRCASPFAATLDARFKFFPRNGPVPEGEPLRIEVECTPRSVGPQKYFIAVKNLQNAVDVQYLVVELNPTEEEESITTEPKAIVFRDVVTPVDPYRLESQLLLIRARFPHTHLLLIRSNKPSQFVFFEDPQCRIPLRNPIQRTFTKETVRVYVQYQPSPKSVKDKARAIRAGVIIEGIVQNTDGHLCTVGRVNVPLSVRAGGGSLLVPNPVVDLGTVSPTTTTVKTTVRVVNPSDTFTIRGRFDAKASLYLSVVENSPGEVWTWMPREDKEITLTAQLPTPGLFSEFITLNNLSCAQDPIRIGVTVLRHDETITAVFANGTPVNTVLMPVGAVARGDDGLLQLYNTVSSSFFIRNSATKDIIVASKCALPLAFGAGKPTSPSTGHHGGGRLQLEARQMQKAEWHLVSVPNLTEEQIRSLQNHGSATVHAVAQVFVAQILNQARYSYQQLFTGKRHLPSVEQCVLLIPFTVTLATSEGYASPSRADLGTVGGATYTNRGKDGQTARERKTNNSSVKIQLVNTSSHLPLQLGIVHATVIRFQESRIVVPPGESRETEAVVQLKEIPRQGPFHYEVFFVNELNPENEITVAVTGQYYWKIFQLSYNGSDGIQDSLSLPNLRVDCAGEAPMILSEGKLAISATEQNLRLGLRIAKNPNFEGLVELQLLHYDATSTVDELIFSEESGGGRSGANNNNTNDTNASAVPATPLAGDTTNSGGGAPGGTPAGGQSGGGGSGGGGGATAGGGGTVVSAAGGANNLPASRKRLAVQLRSQTIRLRCVLLTNDLGAIANLFFGSRRKQLPDVWTIEKLAEYEKRQGRAGTAPAAGGTLGNAPGGGAPGVSPASVAGVTASNNTWLGTVCFYNDLTDDEEVEVFGRLEAFTTFSTPNKVSLRPCRVDTRELDGTSSAIVYSGELALTNLCEGYTVELLVQPVLSHALSSAVRVELHGRVSERASSPRPPPPPAPAGQAGVPTESVVEDLTATNNEAASMAAVPPSSLPTTTAGSPPRYVRLSPQETVQLRVVVRAAPGQSIQSVLQSSIEQQVALVAVDNAMPMNVSSTRFSLTPFGSEDEQLPVITLTTTSASLQESEHEGTPSTPDNAGLGETTLPLPSSVSPATTSLTETRPSSRVTSEGVTVVAGLAESGDAPGGEVGSQSPSIPSLESTTTRHPPPLTSFTAESAAAGTTGASSVTQPAPLLSAAVEDIKQLKRATTAPDSSIASLAAATATTVSEGTHPTSNSPPPPPGHAHRHTVPTTTTTAATTGPTLSLTGCAAAPGITGAYSCNVTFPRDEASLPDIGIKNNLTDRHVEYTAAVVSQSPQSWLVLLSTSGALAPGEVQPLRLTVATTDVGSFAAYLAVYNSTTAAEVVYMRLTADIYVPSTGETLFEFTSSSGSRVPSNSTRMVKLGHVYGDDTHRAYIALEIANRSTGVLEFPVSVVKPFRLELRAITAADTGHRYHVKQHHHHHHQHRLRHAPHEPQSAPMTTASRTSSAVETDANKETVRSTHTKPSQPTTAAVEPFSPPMSNPCLLSPSTAPTARDRFVLDAKLVVCHVHGVATRANQKYVVVDPRSRVRLVFVLSCLTLRVPAGFGVYGEADVVFKCKQARDANFTYKATFQAFPPTFMVEREIIVPYDDLALSPNASPSRGRRGSKGADSVGTSGAVTMGGSVTPAGAAEAGRLGPGEVRVHIHNLLARPQTFVFRTQSPVLSIQYASDGATNPDALQRLLTPNQSAVRGSAMTAALLDVPAHTSRHFVVKVDIAKAAALLNYDKDDLGKQPSLCEHAFILNRGNPKERVAVQFRYNPPVAPAVSSPLNTSRGGDPRADSAPGPTSSLLGSPTYLGSAMAAITPAARPLKSGDQHMAEQCVFSFAQRFTNTLTGVSDRILALFAYYAASREMGVLASMAAAPVSAHASARGSSSGDGSTSSSSSSTGSTRSSRCASRCSLRDSSRSSSVESVRAAPAQLSASAVVVATADTADSMNTSLRSPLPEDITPEPVMPSTEASLVVSALEEGPLLASTATRQSSRPHAAADDRWQQRGGGNALGRPLATALGNEDEGKKLDLSPTTWDALHDLLVELTWLVDELLFFSILLRNSRMIDGYCLFIAATVANHPVMRSWSKHRGVLPETSEYRIFYQFIETLDLLPCATPST